MTDATRRTIRTVVQTTIALAVLLPAIVDASGIPATLPWVAGALAVAGGLARVMALPGVQALMPAWLRTHPPADAELRALTRKNDRGGA
ncbi:hypothetical protein SSP35_05_02640 [Streptomyces sp. NBRC 110611]|uniref:hypothetical protein n=1 Tax=Streptomyces sp. NBRC 110611 TaxID=1621259 RepID=UPI0008379C87|nr:hypothetical protein [Streptomyces sp. NBRC 110611]GAU67697.1 hypothetical protein SSP35_05_02640 [Streptomyces sp. NBRC 110611]